ncbi:hypothetical protein NLJ89_g4785 [Agrocybe chaxingu]|uniref:Serine aminopeptidase S33 domain-containing protein n=1 Tax=Agrocybe chaxingu TaxID=84603 RepID=A0A9W8K2J4_9AGAR|nr:hypothetical protein NLJ89_g4785 [Agrocybe chaxingu]
MLQDAYAEAFASSGYACLLFDYRRWGTSDGTPRNIIDISEQLDDYKAVIKYARQNSEEYDGSRVVLWGTSFSGGHVIRLGTDVRPSLLSLISHQPPHQAPFFSPAKPLPLRDNRLQPVRRGRIPTTFNFGPVKTSAYVLAGIVKQLFGAFGLSKPVYISSADRPGEAAMTTPGWLERVKSMAPEEQHVYFILRF